MSDLLAFGETGFRHVLDPGSIDYLLFLVGVAAAYRLPDWREGLRVLTAFTIGREPRLAARSRCGG
ncbi:MAG TPA: HupE/UreJ family protein, partial [Gemmatimonadales bacterium]|nr:HupE/UreJ family protein [Gemmatimonadales bacterium]